MTATENVLVKIMIDARAIGLTPNLDPAVQAAAQRIADAADGALNASIRKPREPNGAASPKKGSSAK